MMLTMITLDIVLYKLTAAPTCTTPPLKFPKILTK